MRFIAAIATRVHAAPAHHADGCEMRAPRPAPTAAPRRRLLPVIKVRACVAGKGVLTSCAGGGRLSRSSSSRADPRLLPRPPAVPPSTAAPASKPPPAANHSSLPFAHVAAPGAHPSVVAAVTALAAIEARGPPLITKLARLIQARRAKQAAVKRDAEALAAVVALFADAAASTAAIIVADDGSLERDVDLMWVRWEGKAAGLGVAAARAAAREPVDPATAAHREERVLEAVAIQIENAEHAARYYVDTRSEAVAARHAAGKAATAATALALADDCACFTAAMFRRADAALAARAAARALRRARRASFRARAAARRDPDGATWPATRTTAIKAALAWIEARGAAATEVELGEGAAAAAAAWRVVGVRRAAPLATARRRAGGRRALLGDGGGNKVRASTRAATTGRAVSPMVCTPPATPRTPPLSLSKCAKCVPKFGRGRPCPPPLPFTRPWP